MYYVDEYKADRKRYETMQYNRCGKSGLKLPAVSLGLWHNFGSKDNYDMMKTLCFTAFDNGITHFDLANNYGPIYGSAEENFGRIMRDFLRPYRNELIISTKAGYDIELTRTIAENVSIPVIASGGAGNMEHFYDAFTEGKADAALAASLFHYKEMEIRDLKKYLAGKGISVRL
mgnify:FL=1